ncbi:glucosamine--fructose-6-phosphate aminotransferase (isomerizing) [Pyrobaculum aerophilum str. IM2]|uniref:Glutamine--fructose-6-phosphate aminotransferase [isomerizing] n=1 Tax=Pyrobaculum aerophilum (strain ATCC 51768 / DSM 7523 / JCM 9630 / CIP 104966 / NBRC 100827 / IM2) TaxID=178306 RepID=GLMS_PYRAE|nr:glutamine--fructose-6-phosphate transaminase (isomerizing) [Pyrobaculum aerophilum]Q8ZTZ0.3 RecName: Full=Glutamine--fructose-6-phosphate aminotransferase [isomerizing]; AltName: Full=D-fructose-6-phosphate amidotransferase; AltName: Full=GFAT; AltName: Full=Glucosamine-6-phosphate synthase; AltName: Full=Hexosephosphate aminotransferase; AltName: Full=L-glutamine--D-fructose-6-phosphate amidotransferase [Pyrobaculum aerophilum str. IM2]AAL64619.1 glucosamine--fructose-6-phosphate aminotransfe
MCGIFGIIFAERPRRPLGEILRRGLERLEYRGYDSAGVAVVDRGLVVKKDAGKVAEVAQRYGFDSLQGVVGLAHTRWATHGKPDQVNAHPHVDCRGVIAVVHNGIIEKYAELKEELMKRGHVFRSETDTEVIAHLVEEYKKQGLDTFSAFKKALSRVRGAYAIALIDAENPRAIYFARNLSPLIIGVGEGFNIVASDIPTVLDHTKRVIAVRDGEYGYITAGEVYIEADGVPQDVAARIEEIPWSAEMATKGGYPHFMLKEIYEQPESLASTAAGLEPAQIETVANALLAARNVYIVGAGTSYHAGLTLAFILPRLRITPIPVISSEYAIYEDLYDKDDLAIAISQSGETIDTIKAVKAMRERGVKVVAVTNVVGSTLSRESDVVLYTRAGPEIGVAATKTFTTQVLTLAAVYLTALRALGHDVAEHQRELKAVPDLARKTIEKTAGTAKELAKRLRQRHSAYYLGRGAALPVAMEGALKLKEVAYLHAEAYPAGESKHGPIALVEEGFPVIFVFSDPNTGEKTLSNVAEMKARGALTIGTVPARSDYAKKLDVAIEVPQTSELFAPILHVIPLQMLAYFTAVERGYDPDKPRNLAKTVTVE